MTNKHSSQPHLDQRTIHRYRLVRDRDGVDDTFEVESSVDRSRIAWVGYWEEVANARRSARKVASFLEAVANDEVQLDLELLIEELKHIASDWGFRDLRQARPDMSDAEVWNWVSEYRFYHGNNVNYPAGLVDKVNLSAS
jgi:hypothetical protein